MDTKPTNTAMGSSFASEESLSGATFNPPPSRRMQAFDRAARPSLTETLEPGEQVVLAASGRRVDLATMMYYGIYLGGIMPAALFVVILLVSHWLNWGSDSLFEILWVVTLPLTILIWMISVFRYLRSRAFVVITDRRVLLLQGRPDSKSAPQPLVGSVPLGYAQAQVGYGTAINGAVFKHQFDVFDGRRLMDPAFNSRLTLFVGRGGEAEVLARAFVRAVQSGEPGLR